MNLKTIKKIIHTAVFLLLVVVLGNQSCYTQQFSKGISQTSSPSVNNLQTNRKEKITFQLLPHNFEYNEVQCILKDHRGYMWFGTTEGLLRYDGINLYLYENNPADSTTISHNAVNAMVEDQNKNLWIGTTTGLDLYNRDMNNFMRLTNINSSVNRLNNDYISALCTDKDSLLWIGTFGDGISVYNYKKQTIKNYPYKSDDPESLSSNRVTCIAIDADNNIWVGTQNGLNLLSTKTGKFKQFFEEPGNSESLSNNNVTSMTIDPEGNLWIGTRGGGIDKLIKRKNNILFKRYIYNVHSNSLSSDFILSLVSDSKGYLWIGTENGGLDRLKITSGVFKIFQVEEGNDYSISSNSIWSLYSDQENRLWIGTYNKGINVIDSKFSKFDSYQKDIVKKNSLTDNDVTGFTEDKQGNVWIATDGGGICRFNPRSRKFDRIIYNSKGHKYLANNAIQAVLYDSKGTIWVGTWAGGIDRLNNNGVRIHHYNIGNDQGGGNNNIFCLYEDSKGNIWACSAGSGLFKFNTDKNAFVPVTLTKPSGILTKSAYVTTITEDTDGSLWVGTLFGLAIIKKTNNNSYSCIDLMHNGTYPNLSSNSINVIFKDSRKRIWVGTTDNGLDLFNRKNNSFTVFQKKNGLPSNSIRGILEDNQGNLWITTNKGVSRFNFDSLSFTNYTTEDGLNSNKFYPRSCLRTKKGEILLGGEKGFNVFYPKNIRNNQFIPPVYLTHLKINNVSVNVGSKNSPLKKYIGEAKEITLTYKQNSFTLEFVALNYTRPLKNEFAYKLDGFDNKWNYINNHRSASYTNIPPGNYVFMVKGSNNDGIWNNTPTRLMITVKPPYWKTWWAKLSYILLFTILIILAWTISNERIKIKNQLKLEQLAREKEHELNEMNIQFFTNISHEFRTPLSLIIAPLESIIHSSRSKIKEQLLVVYRNAQRLLQLTNNLMDLRKLEEGLTNLKVKQGDLVSFITEMSSYFNINAKQHQINFAIESNETGIIGWFDPEKLETILLNLLSNAFKYTPDNGRISIVVNTIAAKDIEEKYTGTLQNFSDGIRYVEITVIDNGTGINSEELPFIFQKFYQTATSGNNVKKGTGIGLALTKGLVEVHHGFIKAESIPGNKTQFSFVLPFDIEAYREDEIAFEPVVLSERMILNESEGSTIIKYEEDSTTSDEIGDKPEILIVEDNEELRSFLAKELSKEYSIAQAGDGKNGLEVAFTTTPDLIVSDILMPNSSGIDLCKAIKTDLRTCHIPVILLTARTTVNDQIEGVETGADAYINKPFNLQLLFAQINQLIQSRRKLYAHFSQDVYIMPNKLTNNEMDQQFIQKAIDYIVLNIANNNLNVEELSVALNLSRSNVYRKIKALTGMTIIEFIRIVRLKQAIKLMQTKKYSLAEIAYQTGFSSPSYFTKSFKDQYGKPPSEYIIQ